MRKSELTKCSHLSLEGNEFLLLPTLWACATGMGLTFQPSEMPGSLFPIYHHCQLGGIVSLVLSGVAVLGLELS